MANEPDGKNPQGPGRFRNLAKVTTAAAMLAALSGCVVAPLGGGFHHPRGVVYVAPTYSSPGPGYAWGHHHRHGWGWRHSRKGWHRGWR